MKTSFFNFSTIFSGFFSSIFSVSILAISLIISAYVSMPIYSQTKKQIPVHYKSIEYPSYTYMPPKPKDYRHEISKSVVAYMVPDLSLDLIEIRFIFENPNQPASIQEKAELGLYSALLVSGGSVKFTPEQIEDSLEFIAASISSYLGSRESHISISSLGEYKYPMLALTEELTLKPRFDRDIFKLQKQKIIDNIIHQFDAPGGVIAPAYEQVMYGSHPFNWMLQTGHVEKIEEKDLKKYTGYGFYPQRVIIAVAGHFDVNEMKTQLQKLTEAFQKSAPKQTSKILPFKEAKAPGLYIFDKEFNQSTIKVGFSGVQRPHDDYYPLTVASYIFGSGGFNSRLVAKVRTEQGLAYSVNSYIDGDYFRTGTVGFSLQTKTESTGLALKLCFEEMEYMITRGITAEELDRAKKGLLESLPSMFGSPMETATIFAQSEYWGRKLNHFDEYPARISVITIEEVNQAFKKYFVKEKARIVITGPQKQIMDIKIQNLDVTQFGAVQSYNLDSLKNAN